MVASSKRIATAISDGCWAIQSSLVPKIASGRFSPLIAGQPEPGMRLLQGLSD